MASLVVSFPREPLFGKRVGVTAAVGRSFRISCEQENKMMRHRASQLLQPLNVTPLHGEAAKKPLSADTFTSKSTRLLLDQGFVRSTSPGNFVLLPLALRSIDKISRLIDDSMRRVGGQKLLMPAMMDSRLWRKTKRMEAMQNELYTTRDRNEAVMVLGPTHEEGVTKLLADISPMSYRRFPLRLYQISAKFRDEMKPRFGLIRSREFIMKDMYTFDTDLASATKTYEDVTRAYDRFFDRLLFADDAEEKPVSKSGSKPFLKKVVGIGDGGLSEHRSHEYHMLSAIGQDELLVCRRCDRGNNAQVDPRTRLDECPECNGTSSLQRTKGIEVAHAFLLADKYSSVLGARYSGLDTRLHNLHMGCFGIGVTRLMAACVEALSTEQEIRWPRSIAPYSLCVICPKPGSKEAAATQEAYDLYDSLNGAAGGPFEDDVLLDERERMSVGSRLREATKTGYTYVVLFGKDSVDKDDPTVELHRCFSSSNDESPASMKKVPLNEIQNVLLNLHGPTSSRQPQS